MDKAIIAWWQELDPSKRPMKVTATQVLKEALGGDVSRPARGVVNDIAKCLRDMGFKRREGERFEGKKTTVYYSTEELRALPRLRAGQTPLTALASLVRPVTTSTVGE